MSDKNAPVQWTLKVAAGGMYRAIQDENGAIIMQVTTYTFRAPEKLDDWQLIAAAPELLAALKAMLNVRGCGTALDCNVCNSARAAIAKAEGKS